MQNNVPIWRNIQKTVAFFYSLIFFTKNVYVGISTMSICTGRENCEKCNNYEWMAILLAGNYTIFEIPGLTPVNELVRGGLKLSMT